MTIKKLHLELLKKSLKTGSFLLKIGLTSIKDLIIFVTQLIVSSLFVFSKSLQFKPNKIRIKLNIFYNS